MHVLIPEVSMHNPKGLFKVALLATPPLPLKLAVPVPAYVVIIPVDDVILRTRLFSLSLKYTFLLESIAIPDGSLIVALVAWPPSPLKLAVPVPAMDVMILIEWGLSEG